MDVLLLLLLHNPEVVVLAPGPACAAEGPGALGSGSASADAACVSIAASSFSKKGNLDKTEIWNCSRDAADRGAQLSPGPLPLTPSATPAAAAADRVSVGLMGCSGVANLRALDLLPAHPAAADTAASAPEEQDALAFEARCLAV